MVDDQKQAVQVGAYNVGSRRLWHVPCLCSIPVGEISVDELVTEMEEEIDKMREELISEKDYQKLQNKFENTFVNPTRVLQV